MTTYVEYTLDDGSSLLVEADEDYGEGIVKAARDQEGNQITKTNKRFVEALHGAKVSTLALIEELKDLPTNELEITFGLKTTGEAGIFAVGKVGMEANFEVKVKWKRPDAS